MKKVKYRANSIQEAIDAIKKEIGMDAIILSTDCLKDEDGSQFFEVVASKQDKEDDNLFTPYSKVNFPKLGKLETKDNNQKIFFNKEAKSNKFSDSTNQKKDYSLYNQDDHFKKIDEIIARKEAQYQTEMALNQNRFKKEIRSELEREKIEKENFKNNFSLIQNELVSIKDMLFLISNRGELPPVINSYPESINLYAKLVKIGVSERWAQKLIQKACEDLKANDKKNANSEDIAKYVLSDIISSIIFSQPFQKKKKTIAAFVGPTGVGKTTTIAKIAATVSIRQKKDVGLISIDSYRIGAFEQLQTYASIMGVACLSAFNKDELKLALRKMKDKDLLLIDTAGHSHLDKTRMMDIKKTIKDDLSISTHLVLSATTGRMNMKEAAEKFAVLNPESYIFTKFDETRKRGSVIEQIMDLKMPISYMTNGQKVPDDILEANKKTILKVLLN